jgi:hypothetical protein
MWSKFLYIKVGFNFFFIRLVYLKLLVNFCEKYLFNFSIYTKLKRGFLFKSILAQLSSELANFGIQWVRRELWVHFKWKKMMKRHKKCFEKRTQ